MSDDTIKDAMPVISTDPAWGEIDTWIDLHAGFGWNIPVSRLADTVGIGLAIQCAGVKARDIAKADMELWRREGRGWRVVEPKEHWFAKLLARKPNSEMSWTEFWRMVIIHLELAQNAYVLKHINRKGEVLELIPIPPARGRPRVSDTGKLYYEFSAGTDFDRAQIGGSNITVPADRVIHLRGRLMDGLMGLSNQTLGHPIFELLQAVNAYQTNLFGSDGKTPLVFETDRAFEGDLADAAFRRLKDQLTERMRKLRAHGDPILLEAGLKAKSVAINSDEARTTETWNQQVSRICGLMETPPHKIFHYESVKYENQAAADNQYASDSLIPTAKNIEEKFRNALLTEDEWDEYWPEFDRMPMLAGDAKTMMEVIDKAMKVSLMEVNEGRERLPLGLNPIAGGDVRLVPVNTALVDREGKVVAMGVTGQLNNDGKGPAESRGLRVAVDNT